MSAEKVVVSAEEIEQTISEPHAPPAIFKKPASPVPLWARIALSLLVPVLPLLCIVAIVLKIALRVQPPRVRYAVASLLVTLLAISGLLTIAATVLMFSLAPIPAIVNDGLPSLDERIDFPALNSETVLTSADISSKLKPLVIVVSPATTRWNHQEVASPSFGAGVLLEANKDGYLFATANHVASHSTTRTGGSPPHVMVTTASDVWSSADVIATAASLDLALLWVPRHSGQARFVQPVSGPADGEEIFVIGHPEGLKYTLSTGIVSGLRDEAIQISAAISPGNSGGPVYDTHGHLIGIVSSKFDHNRDANAENLGFATRTETLRDLSRWSFYGNGRERLTTYLNDLARDQSAPAEIVKAPTPSGGK
jgi:S1-C subfamily serine protease